MAKEFLLLTTESSVALSAIAYIATPNMTIQTVTAKVAKRFWLKNPKRILEPFTSACFATAPALQSITERYFPKG